MASIWYSDVVSACRPRDWHVYPCVVLYSLALAIVGSMTALAATGKSLSIFTLLGIIMLMGPAAKNATLMTTTMIFAMVPFAISTAEGPEWKSGLAWALIGGLTSSLFLTLVIVPVVYMKVDEWKETAPALFSRPSDILRKFRRT